MEKALSVSPPPTNYLPAKNDGISLIKESKKYKQNYIMHRINLKPIEIDEKIRDMVLEFMNSGKKFIQIDNHTIMLNSISSIDPLPIIPEPSEEVKKITNLMIERIEK